MWLHEFLVTMPLRHRALGNWPYRTVFDDLVGRIELLLVCPALNRALAAYGEEVVWRGYAPPRVAQFCDSGMGARDRQLRRLDGDVAGALPGRYQGSG